MAYFFDYTCEDKASIIKGGGLVNENDDGTVSVFVYLGGDTLQPIPMTKACCEAISPDYTFDIDTQQCKWTTNDCSTEIKPFKVVLNPTGNDGVIFSVDENGDETCTLDISFDYLMQFDCIDMITKLSELSPNGLSSNNNIKLITQLQGQYDDCIAQKAKYNEVLSSLLTQLTSTPYVIQCNNNIDTPTETIFIRPPRLAPTRYENLDIGFSIPPNSFPIINEGGGEYNYTHLTSTISSYCLTDLGLQEWERILGTNTYNAWINSNGTDTSLYGCVQVNQLLAADGNTGRLIGTCHVSITARAEINKKIEETQAAIKALDCDDYLLQIQALQPTDEPCSTISSMLETLNVCMTLDMVNPNTGKLETVYEESIFNIGSGNLPTYLEVNQPTTGILSSGETGTTHCENVAKSLMTELQQALPNSGTTEIQNLVENSFDSEWLNFETTITDPIILESIYNEKIKISLFIKDCCVDFGVLIDRIKINRDCSKVSSKDVSITKSPSFDMIRVCDNKKSWLSNENYKHREFDLKFRDTQYDINNYKLAINSKEVDLDINPANAIEQDLFCYIRDNPCLLECAIPPSGFTGCTTCYEPPVSIDCQTDYDFNSILSAQTIVCDSSATTACTVYSIWGLVITIGCDSIYSGDFFTGTTILTAPTQGDYETALGIAATELDLTFSATSNGIGTLTYTPICDEENKYYNKCIKVDLTLDITTNCETKQFQDNINFAFQDGVDYDFN